MAFELRSNLPGSGGRTGIPHCPAASVYSVAAISPPSQGTRGPDTYISVLLAILVGVVHAGLAPVLVLGGVKPDIVLVAVVLVTTSFGFTQGIVWAFVAGTTANLLIPEPLGSVPLAMLAVTALVSAGSTVLGSLVWVYPIGAAFAGSVIADFVALGALTAVGGSLDVGVPLELIIPAAVLNATLAGLLMIPTRILLLRYRPEEKAAW
jgi:cell shape-determining protein MreD